MIRAVVIEDEPRSRDLLQTMLTDYCEGVEIVASASNVAEAYKVIDATRPELLFLDIQLADKTGFQLLDLIPQRGFEVIITSAYEKYAIQAVKYSCLDYLLKPISLEDLRTSISTAGNRLEKAKKEQRSLQEGMIESENTGQLIVPNSSGFMIIDHTNIIHLSADGSYTNIMLSDGNKVVVSNPIGLYEQKLPATNFIRIHRSEIVNRQFIRQYVNGRGGYVILKNGNHLNVAARKKQALLQALGRSEG